LLNFGHFWQISREICIPDTFLWRAIEDSALFRTLQLCHGHPGAFFDRKTRNFDVKTGVFDMKTRDFDMKTGVFDMKMGVF
jgi:hypothetical protein